MANHTITVVNRGSGGRRESNTSSKNKFKNKQVDLKVFNKTKSFASRLSKVGGVAAAAAITARVGINTYANISSAATGDEMRYSNLQFITNSITNPIGFVSSMLRASLVDSLRINRQNESLNYQRQLTGDLSYSKKFNTGAF